MFLRRLLSLWVTVSFLATSVIPPQKASAQTILNLPEPGNMVSLSTAYTPVLIKGIKINPTNPLNLDFIIATGDAPISSQNDLAKDPSFKIESQRLINYFFAALTLPEKDVWVNLSPYEKDRIVPKATGETEMGRDMLAEDYILKQMTASLIYPEKGLGKEFWSKVYAEATERFGTTQIPVNTFNKVWIVADKASVYEAKDTVIVVDSHLKVMLEEDYLAMNKHKNSMSFPNAFVGNLENGSPIKTFGDDKSVNSLGAQIIRQIVLPALEKEVNEGKNFANLRQIFHSLILAKWYKETLKTALLNQVYSNKAKIKGVGYKSSVILNEGPHAGHAQVALKDLSKLKDSSATPQNDTEAIYQQYLKAYKKGVFNYIKEDIDQTTKQPIPRKYFSGGISNAMTITPATRDAAQISIGSQSRGIIFDAAVIVKIPSSDSITPVDAKQKGEVIDLMIRQLENPKVLHPQGASALDYYEFFGYSTILNEIAKRRAYLYFNGDSAASWPYFLALKKEIHKRFWLTDVNRVGNNDTLRHAWYSPRFNTEKSLKRIAAKIKDWLVANREQLINAKVQYEDWGSGSYGIRFIGNPLHRNKLSSAMTVPSIAKIVTDIIQRAGHLSGDWAQELFGSWLDGTEHKFGSLDGVKGRSFINDLYRTGATVIKDTKDFQQIEGEILKAGVPLSSYVIFLDNQGQLYEPNASDAIVKVDILDLYGGDVKILVIHRTPDGNNFDQGGPSESNSPIGQSPVTGKGGSGQILSGIPEKSLQSKAMASLLEQKYGSKIAVIVANISSWRNGIKYPPGVEAHLNSHQAQIDELKAKGLLSPFDAQYAKIFAEGHDLGYSLNLDNDVTLNKLQDVWEKIGKIVGYDETKRANIAKAIRDKIASYNDINHLIILKMQELRKSSGGKDLSENELNKMATNAILKERYMVTRVLAHGTTSILMNEERLIAEGFNHDEAFGMALLYAAHHVGYPITMVNGLMPGVFQAEWLPVLMISDEKSVLPENKDNEDLQYELAEELRHKIADAGGELLGIDSQEARYYATLGFVLDRITPARMMTTFSLGDFILNEDGSTTGQINWGGPGETVKKYPLIITNMQDSKLFNVADSLRMTIENLEKEIKAAKKSWELMGEGRDTQRGKALGKLIDSESDFQINRTKEMHEKIIKMISDKLPGFTGNLKNIDPLIRQARDVYLEMSSEDKDKQSLGYLLGFLITIKTSPMAQNHMKEIIEIERQRNLTRGVITKGLQAQGAILDEDILADLKNSKGFKIIGFKPGEEILKEGEAGRHMYLILEGEVNIVKDGQLWATRYPGEIVGEMAALTGFPRVASVIAARPVKVMLFPGSESQRIVQDTLGSMARLVAERLESPRGPSTSEVKFTFDRIQDKDPFIYAGEEEDAKTGLQQLNSPQVLAKINKIEPNLARVEIVNNIGNPNAVPPMELVKDRNGIKVLRISLTFFSLNEAEPMGLWLDLIRYVHQQKIDHYETSAHQAVMLVQAYLDNYLAENSNDSRLSNLSELLDRVLWIYSDNPEETIIKSLQRIIQINERIVNNIHNDERLKDSLCKLAISLYPLFNKLDKFPDDQILDLKNEIGKFIDTTANTGGLGQLKSSAMKTENKERPVDKQAQVTQVMSLVSGAADNGFIMYNPKEPQRIRTSKGYVFFRGIPLGTLKPIFSVQGTHFQKEAFWTLDGLNDYLKVLMTSSNYLSEAIKAKRRAIELSGTRTNWSNLQILVDLLDEDKEFRKNVLGASLSKYIQGDKNEWLAFVAEVLRKTGINPPLAPGQEIVLRKDGDFRFYFGKRFYDVVAGGDGEVALVLDGHNDVIKNMSIEDEPFAIAQTDLKVSIRDKKVYVLNAGDKWIINSEDALSSAMTVAKEMKTGEEKRIKKNGVVYIVTGGSFTHFVMSKNDGTLGEVHNSASVYTVETVTAQREATINQDWKTYIKNGDVYIKNISGKTLYYTGDVVDDAQVSSALAFPGGIDFNASRIGMTRLGSAMDISINPAMVARLQQGNFDGIDAVITGVTRITSLYPLLGFKEPEDNRKLAAV